MEEFVGSPLKPARTAERELIEDAVCTPQREERIGRERINRALLMSEKGLGLDAQVIERADQRAICASQPDIWSRAES